MPGDVLTILCGRCRSVVRVDLSLLGKVPAWVALLTEAFREAGIRGVSVETCDVCVEMPAPRDAELVLSELKRRIEGR